VFSKLKFLVMLDFAGLCLCVPNCNKEHLVLLL
jgi:hypothetical protein